MTHVLDRMIEELDALAGALRRRDQNTLGGKTSTSERELYESAEESLRILRAERDGRRFDQRRRGLLGSLQKIAGWARNSGRHDWYDKLLKAVHLIEAQEKDADELRAEGRREERERVVTWLRDQSDRLANERAARPPYTGARDEDAVADALLYAIEDGDHWRSAVRAG